TLTVKPPPPLVIARSDPLHATLMSPRFPRTTHANSINPRNPSDVAISPSPPPPPRSPPPRPNKNQEPGREIPAGPSTIHATPNLRGGARLLFLYQVQRATRAEPRNLPRVVRMVRVKLVRRSIRMVQHDPQRNPRRESLKPQN